MNKEQIYDMMVKCSGPHTLVKNNTNRDRDKKDLYSSFHFENFSYDNALRNTALRFEEFGLQDLSGKSLIDIGSNIGGMSFEALRRHANTIKGFEYVQERVDVCNELATYLGLNKKAQFSRLDLNTVLNNENDYYAFVSDNHADIVFCLAVDAYVDSKYKLYQLIYDITNETCFFETNSGIPESFFTDLMLSFGFERVISLGTSKSDIGYGRRSYKLTKPTKLCQRFYVGNQQQYNHTVVKSGENYIFEFFNINQYMKIQRLYQRIKSNPFVIDMEFSPPMKIITKEHGQSLEQIRKTASIEDKKTIKQQLIAAIKLLHQAGIAHMDLHTKNICYKDGKIKIIDWEYIEICLGDIQSHYDISAKGMGGFPAQMKTHIFCDIPESIKLFLSPVEITPEEFISTGENL